MTYLTVVIGTDGHVYNISNDEHPLVVWSNEKKMIVKTGVIPKTAFCCSEEEYIKMAEKRGQKIEPNGRTLAEIERARRELEGKGK